MGDVVRYLENRAITGLIIGPNNNPNNVYTFPPTPGTEDQYMALDANNNLQWVSGGGGGMTGITNSDGNLTLSGTSTVNINFATNIEVDGTVTLGAAGANEYTLPAADGTNGQVLKTNGSGVVTWEDDAAGAVASVSGTTNQISASTTTGAVTLSLPSTIICPGTLTATSLGVTSAYTLPVADGSSGQVLKTDGAGAVTWQTDAEGAVASVSGTANQISASTATGAVTLSLPSTIIAPGTLTATSLGVTSAYTLPVTDGTINQVLKTNGAGSVAWATDQSGTVASVTGTTGEITVSPTTGACIVSLPNAVTIQSTLAVGTSNMSGPESIGSFSFDNLGNLNLPLNSNAAGNTYIRAGDNTATTTNSIDMFCNWNSTTGVYGGECYLDNTQAYIGIDGVSNAVTNYITVDNTTTSGQGTITARVQQSADNTKFSKTVQNTVSLTTTLTNENYLKLDDGLTSVGNGTFSVSCHNTSMNTNAMLSFTNSSTVGGVLQVPYLTASTYNVNGSYDLPHTTTNTIGDVLTVTGTGTTAFVTPGALTGRLIVSSAAIAVAWDDSAAGAQELLPAISGQAYQIVDIQLQKTIDTTETSPTLHLSAFNGTTYTDYCSISAVNFNTLENTYQCNMSSRNSSGVPVIVLGNASIGEALANQSIVFRQTGTTPDSSGGFNFSFSYYLTS